MKETQYEYHRVFTSLSRGLKHTDTTRLSSKSIRRNGYCLPKLNLKKSHVDERTPSVLYDEHHTKESRDQTNVNLQEDVLNPCEDTHSRRSINDTSILPPPRIHRITSERRPLVMYDRIGHPSLGIFQISLPKKMLSLLDSIIVNTEMYVKHLPSGWKTDLNSLTRQDVPLRMVPGMSERMQPIVDFVTMAVQYMYGCRRVLMDKNQPHLLKYSVSSGQTGVELHHDRCGITVNLVLSRSDDYEGGGTFFPDADGQIVRLEQGEFLLHPGALRHGGMDIYRGTRFLMVFFLDLDFE